jgi:hypothetical protein
MFFSTLIIVRYNLIFLSFPSPTCTFQMNSQQWLFMCEKTPAGGQRLADRNLLKVLLSFAV